MNNKNRYHTIDGLRTFAAIGIILMHVKANMNITIEGYLYNNIIPLFTNFVFLFMIISGFGMCCGYYDKIKSKQITPNEFYGKRYKKILPFFSILIFIDLILSHNLKSVYEGFANLTLVYGFLPNSQLSVIGVGWTLGIIFGFYMLFPFFCFLLQNKKRAWISFLISFIFNVLCIEYFFKNPFVVESYRYSTNIIYCSIFFIAGGIIYLYKDFIVNKLSQYRWIVFFATIILAIIYFFVPVLLKINGIAILIMCLFFSLWLVYAIISDGKILNNRITKFISDISMEMYLCHMMIFRIIEKSKIQNIINNDILAYIIMCILTTIGAISFSKITQLLIEKVKNKYVNNHLL